MFFTLDFRFQIRKKPLFPIEFLYNALAGEDHASAQLNISRQRSRKSSVTRKSWLYTNLDSLRPVSKQALVERNDRIHKKVESAKRVKRNCLLDFDKFPEEDIVCLFINTIGIQLELAIPIWCVRKLRQYYICINYLDRNRTNARGFFLFFRWAKDLLFLFLAFLNDQIIFNLVLTRGVFSVVSFNT